MEVLSMKKALSIFCIFVITFAFVSCSANETPEQAVSKALTAVKELDKATIQKYFGEEDLINKEETEEELDHKAEIEMLDDEDNFKLFVKNISFEILSSNIKDDKATVTAKITNIDMKPIFREYMRQAFSIAMSEAFFGDNEQDDEELQKEMEQIFIDLLSDEENKKVTSTVEIKLSKDKNSWKIDADDVLLDAILGGFYSVAKSFEDDSDEEEVKREISKFELGEAISIKDDGGNELYNLLINSILLSDERNQFHENEPAQVIEIDYTYENISQEDELYISESNFKVIDEGGTIASTYPNSPKKHPQSIPTGSNCTAQMFFGLENKSNKIDILFYDDTFDDKPMAKIEASIKTE
jgi:hypothetical protein